MRKALSGILLGILSLMFIVTTAGSSNAAVDADKTKLKIVRVHYNSKGVDLVNNAWQEGVLIKNTNGTDTTALDLTVFRIRDTYKSSVNTSDWQDRFTNSCPLVGTLPAGQTVYVTSSSAAYASYANRITANQYIYCDFDGNGKGHNGGIFNNMGDTAYVQYRDPDGTQHTTSAKSYGFDNGYYVN
jgi:hypothetical protein